MFAIANLIFQMMTFLTFINRNSASHSGYKANVFFWWESLGHTQQCSGATPGCVQESHLVVFGA